MKHHFKMMLSNIQRQGLLMHNKTMDSVTSTALLINRIEAGAVAIETDCGCLRHLSNMKEISNTDINRLHMRLTLILTLTTQIF